MNERIEWVLDHFKDKQYRQISRGVRLARHSLCEGYEIHAPKLTRVEANAFHEFEDRYLQKSIAQMHKAAENSRQYALMLATRAGYEQAETDLTDLIKYIENMGGEVEGPEQAVAKIVHLLDAFRARNEALEQYKIDSDELAAALERDRDAAREKEHEATQKAWKAHTEISRLRDYIRDNETRAGLASTGRIAAITGPGAGSDTHSPGTLRILGVGSTEA